MALGTGVVAEHPQRSLIRCEAEHRVEEGGLSGAVRADESEDAALFDRQVDAVERDSVTVRLAQVPRLDGGHWRQRARAIGVEDVRRVASRLSSSSGVKPSR